MAEADGFGVRRLGPADIAQMRALLRVFGEAFGEVETYQAKPPSDSYLQRLLADAKFVALAALEGTDVIGGLPPTSSSSSSRSEANSTSTTLRFTRTAAAAESRQP